MKKQSVISKRGKAKKEEKEFFPRHLEALRIFMNAADANRNVLLSRHMQGYLQEEIRLRGLSSNS